MSLGAWLGILGFGAVVAVALLAPVLAPCDPARHNLRLSMEPPGPGHPFGTDEFGRDVLSRALFGARTSLLVSLSAVMLQLVLGVALGVIAGYLGGPVETVLMRLVDVWLALPFLVLCMSLAAILGPGLGNTILVLGLTGWASVARVIRGETLVLKELAFVESARAQGCSTARIILRHLLPNLANTCIVLGTFELGRMITMEAALSFLGLGLPPGTASWGIMIAEGREFVGMAWWVVTFPGMAIALSVLSVNLLGDWVRAVLDPRSA
ncbi:MAG: ABC transporter permease [Acetobacteraceae bacterium]|nr:ABC transporter permease [Acetobacteraceae bacterium]